MNAIRGLYAITNEDCLRTEESIDRVDAAIRGGARIIQYRNKRGDAACERQALALARLCAERGVLLIVNDDPRLAQECRAGVHLGKTDSDIASARARLGRQAVIGVSCYNDLERALTAQAQGADYVAFGRFFPSRTKPDAVQATPALLRAAKARLRIPIVAIGGITPDNGAVLLEAGADALAVIDGVFGQPDPEQAARRYCELFTKGAP